MARVMSLSFLVFLGVPILAPSLGQLILLVAPWEGIFGVLAFAGVALMIWTGLRLPETLHPEDRLPIEAKRIAGAFRAVITNRQAMGYTLAMAAVQGALFGFINSSQQIFYDVFEAPGLFTTGQYLPLQPFGTRAANVFAFERRLGDRRAVVVIQRLITGLESGDGGLPSREAWGDTAVELKFGAGFRNVFTGKVVVPDRGETRFRLAELLGEFPVALLYRRNDE